MRNFNAELMARAALIRLDHGDELTWDVVTERIAGFGSGMTKPELEQVIGFLAASLLTRPTVGGAA